MTVALVPLAVKQARVCRTASLPGPHSRMPIGQSRDWIQRGTPSLMKSPTMLLHKMAERHSRTSRILMDSVDDAPLEEHPLEWSLAKLEDTITAVLAQVAAVEREEAARSERRLKGEQRRKRQQAASERALAARMAAEHATKPLGEKVASAWQPFGNAISTAAKAGLHAIDPSRAEAEARLAEEMAAEAAAVVERDAALEAEALRRRRRMKKIAPVVEELSVRLVRGLDTHSMAPGEVGRDDAAAGQSPSLTDESMRERSKLVGTTILIDQLHPDFKARSRQGTVDERLCGYVAAIVSSHYRERAYQAACRQRIYYAQAYEEMLSTFCRLEEALSTKLCTLRTEMSEAMVHEAGG
eukprot:CAMPEP_0119361658 /NCGR_PEP_ID=MMETSP1334-20130426/8918_1 /TAXON_ID=127549 /ORGANISM="Calcidiscus leptoporus, Strain RCC1130" /LENGTH=354 /DNA_ID=CAMNT_0007376727 /DNA_START=128 /DNA_END=1192 /DNA_ORIENTATION=+